MTPMSRRQGKQPELKDARNSLVLRRQPAGLGNANI